MAPIGQFLGSSFRKLRKGSIITGPFEQVSSFFPDAAVVPFGSLLKYGSAKKFYEVMEGDETDATEFAGVAIIELASSSNTYPGIKSQYEIGEAGNVLIVGAVAVPFSASTASDSAAVVEGGKVYLAADGLVTQAADNGLTLTNKVDYLLMPNLRFTGDVETVDSVTLVGVRKLY